MDSTANPDFRREIASALDWWREAGVDLDLRDAPASLLTPPTPGPAPAPAENPAKTAARPRSVTAEPEPQRLDLSAMPTRLADFREWWLAEPGLDGGRVHARVPPRGPAGADLMIIVGDPEAEDGDALLSGSQGKLLASFLDAAGIESMQVYFASVLPRHLPHADWAAVARDGFGNLLARHIAMVRPKRILAFDGNNLPLTGNDWPNSPDSLRQFNHDGMSIPLLAARGLAALLERARWKAGLWQGWLDWTRGG